MCENVRMTTVNPIKANPRPEEAWLDADVRRLHELHAQLLDAGYTAAFVNGLVGWIVAGGADAVSTPTAAGYRKALRELEPPRRTRPHGRRARGERGHAIAGRLALAGSAAGSGLLMAHEAGATGPLSALSAVVPIIVDPSGYDASEGHTAPQVRGSAEVIELRQRDELVLARAS